MGPDLIETVVGVVLVVAAVWVLLDLRVAEDDDL